MRRRQNPLFETTPADRPNILTVQGCAAPTATWAAPAAHCRSAQACQTRVSTLTQSPLRVHHFRFLSFLTASGIRVSLLLLRRKLREIVRNNTLCSRNILTFRVCTVPTARAALPAGCCPAKGCRITSAHFPQSLLGFSPFQILELSDCVRNPSQPVVVETQTARFRQKNHSLLPKHPHISRSRSSDSHSGSSFRILSSSQSLKHIISFPQSSRLDFSLVQTRELPDSVWNDRQRVLVEVQTATRRQRTFDADSRGDPILT